MRSSYFEPAKTDRRRGLEEAYATGMSDAASGSERRGPSMFKETDYFFSYLEGYGKGRGGPGTSPPEAPPPPKAKEPKQILIPGTEGIFEATRRR